MDNDRNLPVLTHLAAFNAVAVLNKLGIALDKTPEAPALRLVFETTVKEFTQNGMPSLDAREKAQDIMIDLMENRLHLIKKYEKQFFQVFRNEDSSPHDHDSLMIAALCDSSIMKLNFTDQDGVNIGHAYGMDTGKLKTGHDIWEQLINFYDDAENAHEKEAEDDLENYGEIIEDNATLESDRNETTAHKNIQANNDNTRKEDRLMYESLFLAHICGMEQLREIEQKFDTYTKNDLKQIYNENLNFITSFVKKETRIGRDLVKWMEQTETRIDHKLNPRAITAQPLTPIP